MAEHLTLAALCRLVGSAAHPEGFGWGGEGKDSSGLIKTRVPEAMGTGWQVVAADLKTSPRSAGTGGNLRAAGGEHDLTSPSPAARAAPSSPPQLYPVRSGQWLGYPRRAQRDARLTRIPQTERGRKNGHFRCVRATMCPEGVWSEPCEPCSPRRGRSHGAEPGE